MTITAVIPTLDEAATLPRTLSHTKTLGFDQIIIVDGGSQDGTQDLLETLKHPAPSVSSSSRYPDIICLETNPGRARQMNAGAAATDSDVLLFLHADTLLPVNSRKAIEAALDHPRAIGGRFNVRFERDDGWAWVISRMMNLRSRWSGIATGDQAIFVRNTSFETVGGFTNIPLMEDIDFSRRLKSLGNMVALPDKVQTSFRRWEQCGPLKTILLMWTLRVLFWLGVSPERLSHWYRRIR